jgi:hypothetical protein
MVVFVRRHRQQRQRGGGGGLPAILEKIFGTIRNKLEQDTKDTIHRQPSRHISLTSLYGVHHPSGSVYRLWYVRAACMLHRAASATLVIIGIDSSSRLHFPFSDSFFLEPEGKEFLS